jgi:hypothetical protein
MPGVDRSASGSTRAPWSRQRGFGLAALMAAAALGSTCRVDEDDFYGRTFFCDANMRQSSCGTDRAGLPRTCVAGKNLGGRDFCTGTCSMPSPNAAGGPTACLSTRGLVETCQPNGAQGGCQTPELSCLRTDALRDEGVCLAVKTCSSNQDCDDPARDTCLGSLLVAAYGSEAGLKTDHFSCLQAGCEARGSNCSSGESCLRKIVPGRLTPDICVPNCDPQFNCPPNYFCYRKVSGQFAENVCIPGIIGFRCFTDMDCLLGECVDTGEGFNVCSVPCENDTDCARFDRARGPLFCGKDPDGQGRHCINPVSQQGTPCNLDSECGAAELCLHYIPNERIRGSDGECRPRCGPGGACRARGGVPHACTTGPGRDTCYPGHFAVACSSSADCVGDLTCLPTPFIGDDDRKEISGSCTVRCQRDEDCAANRWINHTGYCDEGVCAFNRAYGRLCDEDRQCGPPPRCLPSERPGEADRRIRRCLNPPPGAP